MTCHCSETGHFCTLELRRHGFLEAFPRPGSAGERLATWWMYQFFEVQRWLFGGSHTHTLYSNHVWQQCKRHHLEIEDHEDVLICSNSNLILVPYFLSSPVWRFNNIDRVLQSVMNHDAQIHVVDLSWALPGLWLVQVIRLFRDHEWGRWWMLSWA